MVVDYKIGFFNESDVSNHRKQWLSSHISLKYINARKQNENTLTNVNVLCVVK